MITLIDTSAWVEALRKNGDKKIREAAKNLLESGDARITEPVIVEIWNGARGKEEILFIKEMEKNIPLLNCNEPVYLTAYNIAKTCRSRGFTIPAIDILIFAVSVFYKTDLLHKDNHFNQMKQ